MPIRENGGRMREEGRDCDIIIPALFCYFQGSKGGHMAEHYQNPLWGRYASEEMQRIYSPDHKFITWRKLWIALAESERALGLPISEEQIEEMRRHRDPIDYDAVARYEKELRHDVMAHIHAYADQCPKAAPIIHLGATSSYVGDNTDLMTLREGLELIRIRLVAVIRALAAFAEKQKDQAILAYTHYQAAQPTTLGKRACTWLQDLIEDLDQLEYRIARIPFFGCKGATGTAASFLSLFEGDAEKVRALEKRIAHEFGFTEVLPISGQTYPRKVDYFALSVLSGIAQSISKMATDIRLMSHDKVVDEPFEQKQVGSSAMPYKRNPMRCERMVSLSRLVIHTAENTPDTSVNQWLERTLDDSANRRIVLAEAFLGTDGILRLAENVVSGLVVYPKRAERMLQEELPFIASENILMHAVERGGNRQELHEVIRMASQEAAYRVKQRGEDNPLLEILAADPRFEMTREDFADILNTGKFVGLAPQQTEDFLQNRVRPLLAEYTDICSEHAEIEV